MSERTRGRLAASALAALWLLPLVVVGALWKLPSYLETRATTARTPLTQAVGLRSYEQRTEASLKVTPGATFQLLTQASGLVTSINRNAVGTPLAEGRRVLATNGMWSLAQTGRPFYRPLSRGETGPDVVELSDYLRRIGIRTARTSTYTAELAEAVRALQRRIAITNPDGVFQPAYVLYFPAPSTRITSYTIELGSTTAPGAPVAQALSGTATTAISSPDGTGTVPDFGNQPISISIGSTRTTVDSLSLTPEQQDKLAQIASQAAAAGEIQTTGPAADGSITYTGVKLELATPEKYGTVPVSAVFTDSSGTTCLFTGKIGGWSPTPLAGLPPSNEIGVAYAPVELVGMEVLLNPTNAIADATCT